MKTEGLNKNTEDWKAVCGQWYGKVKRAICRGHSERSINVISTLHKSKQTKGCVRTHKNEGLRRGTDWGQQ